MRNSKIIGPLCIVIGVVAVAWLINAGASSAASHETPPVFSKIPFDRALQKAAASNKLLVVDATAVWCPPCQRMNQTTWVDEDVTDWLNQHAIAVQVDVDRRPNVARQLGIRVMPTILAFREGEPVGRIMGYRNADQLLGWLHRVSEEQQTGTALGQHIHTTQEMNLQARVHQARRLMRAGEYEKATEQYVWMWNHLTDEDSSIPFARVLLLHHDMKRLASRYKPALKQFTAMRDEVAEQLNSPVTTWKERKLWILLNAVVDQPDKTLAWFDHVKNEPAKQGALASMREWLEPTLVEAGRWEELGSLYPHPVQAVTANIRAFEYRMQSVLPKSDHRQRPSEQRVRNDHRKEAAVTYASVLATGREKAARQVAQLAIEAFGAAETRAQLVRTALKASEARSYHLDWLDQAAKAGDSVVDLRKQVRAALDQRT